MPFDGKNFRLVEPMVEPIELVVVDLIEKRFDGGRLWHAAWTYRGNPRYHPNVNVIGVPAPAVIGATCLVGALRSVRMANRIRHDRTTAYLTQAACEIVGRPGVSLIGYNDEYCAAGYKQIRQLLDRARKLIRAEAIS